jgi:hypothetical protein
MSSSMVGSRWGEDRRNLPSLYLLPRCGTGCTNIWSMTLLYLDLILSTPMHERSLKFYEHNFNSRGISTYENYMIHNADM